MPAQARARKRPAQARRVRRFEADRPDVVAVLTQGSTWTGLNLERLPGLILTLGCLACLTFLFVSPRFYVYEARVTGAQSLPAEQVYQASAVDMLSIFIVDPRLAERRLLAQLPQLQRARVALGLPAIVHIHVAEREAHFVWEAGGQSYLVDERGILLGSGSAPPDSVRIRAEEGSVPLAGQPLDMAVLDTARRLSELLGGQRSFEHTQRQGIGWRTERGWPVYFGVGGDLSKKVAVMRALDADLERRGIRPQFVDVGVPSRPYYR